MPGQMKRFANFFSRSAVRARQNLGIVLGDDREGIKKFRNKELNLYDSYYESTQYSKMPEWDETNSKDSEFIPVRKRQPRIIYNFGKVLVDRITAKLVGSDVFPKFAVEDDPDDTTFIQMVIKVSKLKQRSLEAVKLMCLSGSSLLRYYLVDGSMVIETYHSNYCYPVFKPNGTLDSVAIQYTYKDEADKDGAGKPKEKWYKLELGNKCDILYDNPPYSLDSAPSFKPVSTVNHNLGFVQAEWLRTSEDRHSPDGTSLIQDVLDFIDELNYSISQSSQAVGYGQEPQLALSGMDMDDIDGLIKSSTKVWNLGREGKAAFVETRLEGAKQAQELRDKCRLAVQDVARVCMLDPEKMVGHAQSGKAMEVLHGPFIELINELRPQIEEKFQDLITKMAVTFIKASQDGQETDLVMPDGYVPSSLDMTATWPHIFPLTLEDLNIKTTIAAQITGADILSRESITRWIAKDFGVENIDEELEKISEQEPLNPMMGSSMFGGDSGSKSDSSGTA